MRELAGAAPSVPRFDDVYDAFQHPRRERPSLDILDAAGARDFDAAVRTRALDVLDRIDLDRGDPLLTDGFVYGMVVQHEHQHDETLLATLQLMDDFVHPDADGDGGAGSPAGPSLDARRRRAGAGWHLRDRHRHRALGLRQRTPGPHRGHGRLRSASTPRAVTNGAYTRFVEAGGYDDRACWSDAGWAWRTEAGLIAPQFWQRAADDGWTRHRFGRDEPLPADEPVQHVCWYEADAYARGTGSRLPTEAEWELAARGASPATANLWREGPHRFAPSPVDDRLRPRQPVRRVGHAGRRVGVDRVRLHAVPRFPRRSPTASTRRCSSAPSTRCCAAARGRRTRARCARRSATGTFPSAGRSSPGSAARATPDAADVPPPRVPRPADRAVRPVVRRAALARPAGRVPAPPDLG